jgi:arylformamidase
MEIDEQGRRIWDISQPLRVGIPVWPGDTPFEERRTFILDEQCPVNVSRLTLSTHTGTHADAPCHYDAHGKAAAALPIATYLGRTQVLSVIDHNGEIQLQQVRGRVALTERRLLLRTFASFPTQAWPGDFASLSPELVDALGEQGLMLIGTDAPSLDPQSCKDLRAHRAASRHALAILEGLVLDGVPDGYYELIAIPLRLVTADASPVRAILRELRAAD